MRSQLAKAPLDLGPTPRDEVLQRRHFEAVRQPSQAFGGVLMRSRRKVRSDLLGRDHADLSQRRGHRSVELTDRVGIGRKDVLTGREQSADGSRGVDSEAVSGAKGSRSIQERSDRRDRNQSSIVIDRLRALETGL
jgi:hypothetical protein